MKKKLSKILTCGLCLAMAAVFTAGCTGSNPGTGKGEDPETRAFVMAIGATDGNFSPFFATAQYDVQVTELTQISMLTANEKGKIAYGENEPTVVLDMKETLYEDKAGTVVSQSGNMNGKSVYELVIKNGIKFSDGSDLTIKDVLFNLYVYLDPVYFGSSTIYSTDIIGLAKYRTQDPLLDDDADNDILSSFEADAQSRINSLMEYIEKGNIVGTTEAQLNADINTLQELFLDEVTSDWTSIYGTLDDYTKEYTFTSNWEVYYLNEGLISILYDLQEGGNRVERKDKDGKYLTTLDDTYEDGTPKTDYREEMEAALSDEERISKLIAENDGFTRKEALDYIERETAIKTVYESKVKKESNLPLLSIFTEGWATASNFRDKIAKQLMSDYFENSRVDGELKVPNISGITTYKTSTFNGKNLGEPHDVLKVEINGVDPKAIWNLAFQVAPAYYYSGKFNSVDYRDIDIAKNQFGVCFGNSDFFDKVLNDPAKSSCPVGAGTYQACSSSGTPTTKGDAFHPGNKFSYYTRNNYFETVGKGISNAKIKYVRYREIEDSQLVNTLKSGEVDYGEPSCTNDNLDALKGSKLSSKTPKSSGYGYVGINPHYIPDINVRRAIIKAMNIGNAVSFYSEENSDPIYRPMSTANWVYDYIKNDGPYYTPQYNPATIKAELQSKGWDFSSGVGKKDGYTLKYTFTIAGNSTDHPAYLMFSEAAKILNKAGFDISVTTDVNALKSLATGALTVWAAAYTSPIDPDLYQVYHKDSKATSVKNWGYDDIKQNTKGLYTYEKGVLEDLSDLIMEARQTTSEQERGGMYKDALDLIMELAIQLPTYQRNDLVVYNRVLLDSNTLNGRPTAYAGVLNRIWEVNYSK